MRFGPKTLLAAALRFRYSTAFTFSKMSTRADARKARAGSLARTMWAARRSVQVSRSGRCSKNTRSAHACRPHRHTASACLNLVDNSCLWRLSAVVFTCTHVSQQHMHICVGRQSEVQGSHSAR